MEIRTTDDWWQMLVEHKDALRHLVATYHPLYARYAPPLEITAPSAQEACDKVCEQIEKEMDRDPLLCFDKYLAEKNAGLVNLLNETWYGLPESNEVRSLPGFFALCDLCSESYILYEDKEEKK